MNSWSSGFSRNLRSVHLVSAQMRPNLIGCYVVYKKTVTLRRDLASNVRQSYVISALVLSLCTQPVGFASVSAPFVTVC
jgi:hypothetical protein